MTLHPRTNPKHNGPHGMQPGRLRHEVLRHLAGRAGVPIHIDHIGAAMRAAGCITAVSATRAARHALDHLRTTGYVRNHGVGMWTITPAGADELLRTDPATPTADPGSIRNARANASDGPACTAANRALLVRGIIRPIMSDADRHPCAERRDGQEALEHPSRRGNYLQYRDGRRTDLEGKPIKVNGNRT